MNDKGHIIGTIGAAIVWGGMAAFLFWVATN